MSSAPKVFEKPTLSGPVAQDGFEELEETFCVGYYDACSGTCTILYFTCEWAFTIGGIAAVGIDAAVILAVV